MVQASELSINEGANATAMANAMFGDGVQVIDADYTGDNRSSGIFSGGDNTSPGVVPSDTGVILSTGRVRDFTNSSGQSNQSNSRSSNTQGENNNADFNAAAGRSTYDASYLDIDFIPDGDTMTMQFVFASDEYPEYINSVYNDVFGVWINGTFVNATPGNGQTSVTNINSVNTQNLYVDNTQDQYNTEMDGFTVTMTLTIPVNDGYLNTIRIGIADASDSSYDSSVLIAGDSIQTRVIADDDSMDIFADQTKVLDVLANDTMPSGATLTITHINGNAVSIDPNTGLPNSVTLSTGETVTLNPDGTLSITADSDLGDTLFTYTMSDGTNSDTGYVTLSTIPCFVSGTLILTKDGERPVDELAIGDLVVTHDDGLQPVRWIGTRTIPATENFAPIDIAENALGQHRRLMVSPQHRVLIRDSLAALLFGEEEVLIAAKDLVNDRSIRRRAGGMVTYVHVMFDRHQVVFSEGLATESFLPGPQTKDCFEEAVMEEICAIFPELDPPTGQGYGPAARRTLRRFEAQVLLPA